MKCMKTTTILSAIEPATKAPTMRTHSGVGTRNLLASLKALLFVTATSLFVGMQAEGSGQGNADRIIDHHNQADPSSPNNAHMGFAVWYALVHPSASRLEQALSELPQDKRADELLKFSYELRSIIQVSNTMSDILKVLRKMLDPEGLYQVFSEIVLCRDTLIQSLAERGYVDEVKKTLDCINGCENRELAKTRLKYLILNSHNRYGENLWDISARNSDLRAVLKEYTNGAESVLFALIDPSASKLEQALSDLPQDERADELLWDLPFVHNIIRPLNEQIGEMSGILEVLRKTLGPEGLCQVFSTKVMDKNTLIQRLAYFGYVDEVAKILNCINGIENRERAEELLEDLIINSRNDVGENLWNISAEKRDLRAVLEQYTNIDPVKTCLLDAVKEGGEGAVEAIHQALEGKTPQERYAFILTQLDEKRRNTLAICFRKGLYAAARELLKGLSNEHVYNLLTAQNASDERALHALIWAGNSENAGAELLKELLARLSEDQKRHLAYMEGMCGMTALMCAGTPAMIDIIFSMVPQNEWDAYLRVHIRSSGYTALFLASTNSLTDGRPGIIRALLNYSNDVKTLLSQRCEKTGRTPLMACVQPRNAQYGLQNCIGCINALLGRIKDPALLRKLIQEDKDNSGKSAWDYSLDYIEMYPGIYDTLDGWLKTADAMEASLQNA